MIRVLFVCHGRWCIEHSKPIKIKDSFKRQPEFTTLLRQRKPGYDNNVVEEIKLMKERIIQNRFVNIGWCEWEDIWKAGNDSEKNV